MTEPIDKTHADQMAYVDQIRARVRRLQAEIAEWQPRPCPSVSGPQRR